MASDSPPPLTVLLLAAGQGKRMRSKTIKLLHRVAGQPMVCHVAQACRALRPERLVAVVGHQAEDVQAALDGLCDAFVVQADPRGTGDAVLQAAPKIGAAADRHLMIVNGDLPALRFATLRSLYSLHRRREAALTLVTAEVADPAGYGRVVRDPDGRVVRIVEDRDASTAERKIREINCGIYCARPRQLFPVLRKLKPTNAQGEYYLTDAVHALIAQGEKVLALRHTDWEEVLGVNTRLELARAGAALYARKASELLESGVTLLDPARVWVDPRASVGQDAILYPDVLIEGASRIGEGSVIRTGSRISQSEIGRGVEIRDYCVIAESRIDDHAAVGPFAHLRPGTVLETSVHVGNFVEVKKSRLGRGTKASHLTYLGDADIGAGCNIGAGTITCNYDGQRKHPTKLGDGVFIGSDSQLVAPVEVGDGAYVGAGSTVTENVPSGALALARCRQINLEGWVERRQSGTARKRRREG